ncbi:MAG: hypothetical protein Q7T87_06675 [Polaromonas sp.]|nr:hypothetical protein [Polaromonas sp.]
MFQALAPLSSLSSARAARGVASASPEAAAAHAGKLAPTSKAVASAKPASPKAAGPGLVSRVRSRLFPARSAPDDHAAEAQKRGVGFQASIAELLLINRLKALGRRNHGVEAEIMERASHVVFVTCQNWFTEPEALAREARQTRTSPHRTRL